MHRNRRATRRYGTGTHILSAATLVAIVLPLTGWALLDNWWNGGDVVKGPLTCEVRNATFVHEVSQKGTIECASNVEVKSEADAKGFYTTKILEVVPEGTYVEPGDFLMSLDASPLEDLLVRRTIECSGMEAELIRAEAALETTRIALEEYSDGLYPQQQQLLANQLGKAQEDSRVAERTLGFSVDMYRRGFVTQMAVEADEYAAERAKVKLRQAETKLSVLEEYTRRMRLQQLEASLAVANATARYRRYVYEVALKELDHIKEQIEKCVITAPASGNVVYANTESNGQTLMIEPGAEVWEHRVVFRLPNSDEMQVVVMIPEDKVALVQPGQKARIQCEAFPDIELVGTVKRVNDFASPTNWWGPQTKVFETRITIDTESTKAAGVDLRPGLSAEVFIEVDRREEQLTLPFQAVLKHGKRRFCLTHDRSGFHAREIEVGPSNGKHVIVQEGVEAGEQVVLGAANYRKEVTLPE
ncbi:MAG: HlyD family efflux transporter periplasmic adaptor subunit [Planctomycetaceae bacterium]|nr:HlyD family efflux transporter periplasmic adaptor subunit [Planctomycetaceae bacterium]